MSENVAKLVDTIFDASFISLPLSLAGWALLEVWLSAMHAGAPAHVFTTMTALVLFALSVRHSPLHRRSLYNKRNPGCRRSHAFTGRDALYALLFLAIGGFIGVLVKTSGTLILAAGVVLLTFVPWSRISFCRHHFAVACELILAGIAISLVRQEEARNMFLPLAGWVINACACLALLRRTENLRQLERHAKAMNRV